MSCSYADAECSDRADLTLLVERKAERREVDRRGRFRNELLESLCASVGGGGNIGVLGADCMACIEGVAQERCRWRSKVSRVDIKVSRI